MVKRKRENEAEKEAADGIVSDDDTDGSGDLWKVQDFIRGRWMGDQYVAEYRWRPNWMSRTEILSHDSKAVVRISEFEERLGKGTLGYESLEMSLGASKDPKDEPGRNSRSTFQDCSGAEKGV